MRVHPQELRGLERDPDPHVDCSECGDVVLRKDTLGPPGDRECIWCRQKR